MLHQITFFLFKLRLIQPSEKTIIFWEQTEQVDKLEYALKHGNYKTRKLAAEALEHVGKPSSIPALLNCIYDKVHNVSLACLNALERVSPSEEIIKNVIKKRFIWDKETNRNKKHKIYRWERASKKSFDRVKEQLKRPMR
jgi:uncharacterized protein (DUF2344 family)